MKKLTKTKEFGSTFEEYYQFQKEEIVEIDNKLNEFFPDNQIEHIDIEAICIVLNELNYLTFKGA